MPSIDWNKRMWGAVHSWQCQGNEWSATWGGVETHWFATILPRIRKFLPARRVLEIAPGYGRWSNYLLPLSDSYVGVDLTEECVRVCRERFGSVENATFAVNDGKSLPMIADASIDFAFSFDSLVHVEDDVIDGYVAELSRVLAPQGIGFIHHSNLGSFMRGLVLTRLLERTLGKVPAVLRILRDLGIVDWDHARAKSVDAARFVNACRKAGLICVGQEIIAWGHGQKMIDCLSLVARPGSHWDRPNVVVANADFMGEALSAQRIASVYSSLHAGTKCSASEAHDTGRPSLTSV